MRPVPTIVTDGSTTPAGSASRASNARYPFTSPSVTVVRRPCFVGFSACLLMMSTFCLRTAASRRDARTSADGAAIVQAHMSASSPADFIAVILLRLAIRLTGAIDELELTALHVLFEDAKFRLLAHVENLV